MQPTLLNRPTPEPSASLRLSLATDPTTGSHRQRTLSLPLAIGAQAPETGLPCTDQVPATRAVKGPPSAAGQIHHDLEFVVLNTVWTSNRLMMPARSAPVSPWIVRGQKISPRPESTRPLLTLDKPLINFRSAFDQRPIKHQREARSSPCSGLIMLWTEHCAADRFRIC